MSSAPRERRAAGALARISDFVTRAAERFVPDAFVFALAATLVVVALARVFGHAGIGEIADAWGGGLWDLLPFTMQMALVVITGYVLATAAPVHAVIRALSALPRTPRTATAMVALFAMASSWLNWGFSLVFTAMLALEIARRFEAANERIDYRALAASSLLGLGSVWAQGLSGSAALQMATPSALPAAIRTIVEGNGQVPGGVIGLGSTIFLWQSFVSVLVEIALVTALVYAITPGGDKAMTARDAGIALPPAPEPTPRIAFTLAHPAERLEHSRFVPLAIVALGAFYLARYFHAAPSVPNAVTLNSINLAFLLLGMLLHGTPHRFMIAVRDAVPAVWGILLQFPFYAGIAAIMTKTHLSGEIARAFVSVSNQGTYPAAIAMYSLVLGVFVPSGGSKWIIEAPYVMGAAHELRVHLGWMVCVYDLGEALANLVQPFWMLPVLGLFKLKARDVMGYTFLVFVVLLPTVLVLVTLLARTLHYPL